MLVKRVKAVAEDMAPYLEQSRPTSAASAAAPGLSLREVLFALRRHRRLVLAFTLIGCAAGVALLLSIPPTYTAESSIVLDTRKPRLIDLPSIVSEQTTNPEVAQLRSEVDVLRSESLANRVIDQLHLLSNAEFRTGPSRPLALVADIRRALDDHAPRLAAWLPILRQTPPKQVAPSVTARLERAHALAVYREHLSVINDGGSYIIRVQFSSRDPLLAAQIVNTHVQLYLADQVAYKQEIGKRASTWLTQELSNLEAKLRTSEAAVQSFREQNQIVQSGDTTLLSQQLAAVNAQIPVAEAELERRQSQLERAKELLKRNSPDSEPDVLDSRLVQELREQEATLQQKKADLEATFGERYPKVERAQAELATLEQNIHLAIARIIQGLQNKVDVARVKQSELRQRLTELEQRTVIADRAEGKLRDLRREVSANNALIEVLLTRYKQVSAQEEIQQADARVVSPAMVPISPSFPKFSAHLPIVIAVSFLMGAAVAFLRELTRRGFKGTHEIEVECELPSLGSVPIVPSVWPRQAPQNLITSSPHSTFAEAIRYIKNSIQASGLSARAAPKTFLVTSSLPHEGKSVLAMSLARSFAISGKKTLLIDCDLRNPSVASAIARPRDTPCLTQVLNRDADWRDGIYKDNKSPLDVLSAAAGTPAPHDIVASPVMRALIDQCRRQYDIVILDSPPITAVSDALTLSRWVDATMLAIRWGVTPREIAKTSLNKLFQSGARLCGAVLTQVDLRRGVFSPAEIEYYHKRNRVYYAQ
jgi:polysaccharide biosynthesis transport protein